MIDMVTKNFANVVLVYNGANTLEMGFVNDYPQIKSVIYAPAPARPASTLLGEIACR